MHDRAYKASGAEVEGYDVVLPDAVQAATWPETQSPRPAESDRGFWCAKTRTSCPVIGSYSRTLGTASAAPSGHSLATTMFPSGASFRSSGLSSRSVTRRGVSSAPRAIEDRDGVIAFSGRPDSRGGVKPPVGPEAEPARKRDAGLWQKVVSLRIEGSRHRPYRPLTARREVIAAIGPELGAARVKPGYPPRIAHDVRLRPRGTRSCPFAAIAAARSL